MDIKEKLNILTEDYQLTPKCSWVLLVRVLSAYYLLQLDREYEITFCYQGKSKNTSRRSANNGSIYFNEAFYLQFNSISQNI